MTTPGGVPNLPKGALTLETLASKLQDMTPVAMRGRAAERIPGTYDGSTGGNALSDLSPFGILTQLFAGFNSHVANADPADIQGPEDLPGLLLDFIESLPVIGELVGLLEAILGTYDGDDAVLLDVQKYFGLFRDLFGLIDLDLDDLPTVEEVWQLVVTNFIQPLIDLVGAIGDGLNAILGPIFNGIDFTDPPTPTEVWQAVATVFLVPLNVFAIPSDVQANINTAIGNMKDALDGTYSGTGPIFLAIKAAAAAWLTGTSPLNAGNLTGSIDDGRLPSLGAVRDAIWQAINGGSTTGVTAAQVKTAVAGQQTAITTAGNNASSAIGNWTSWLSGGAWGDIGESVADFLGTKETASTAATDASDAQSAAYQTVTSLYNKLSGNNAPTASQSQAADALQTFVGTVGQLSSALTDIRNQLGASDGFTASIPFRQPEVAVFDVAGSYTPTLPAWFNHATDSLDVPVVGAGGGGGGGLSASSSPGTDTVFKVAGVTKATGVGGASVGSGTGSHPKGWSPGNLTVNDVLFPGGGEAAITQVGRPPGGGGGAGEWFGIQGKGGNAGAWDSVTLPPGAASGALSLTVGDGGAGTVGGFGAAAGADGCAWLRARPGMPASFTSMGTLLLPTYRLNTGVALTDAMTAAATWGRVPPGGSAGGHILIIRANAAFTTYVYLWVKTVSGVTNYELGRVSSGVKSAWKTGTIVEAVPFNSFWLTSDAGYIYTISINGTPFDSYNDTVAHSSMLGASYRSGGWGSSDSALPGSIVRFAFLDSGTPSRIVSDTIATAQATTTLTTSFGDLATTGPSVTLNVPQSGQVTVTVSCALQPSATGYMGFTLSGANTQAATIARAAVGRTASGGDSLTTITRTIHLTGLNPGTTTFKGVYRISTGLGATFQDRNIIVDPKP